MLHDKYQIHTEVCVFLLIGVYVLMWWTGDRHPQHDARTMPNKGITDDSDSHIVSDKFSMR